MQIVIDIPEYAYRQIRNWGVPTDELRRKIYDIIDNGTPLPQGHGRLIDENELIDEIVCEEIDGRYYDVIYAHSIYDANTIIEADKESDVN